MSKYNEDLDYLITDVDISKTEIEEIIAEADKIISDDNREKEKIIEAYLKKVQCLQKLKKYAESKGFIDNLLTLNPNMPEALVRLGGVYDENNEYSKAIEEYNKAIEFKTDYAYAYFLLGYTKNNSSDYHGAIENYTKAIEIKSDYVVAYNNRGVAYKNKGDLNQAIADYDKAIELNLNPKYDTSKNNRVNAYHAKDENLVMKLDKIRDNELYMEELKNNITKVVPFLGAGVSKPYGYYTWKELLQQLLVTCCRYHKVRPETEEEIRKLIEAEDYLKAANELDRIFPNISTAVGILIERAAKANPIKDININKRSILSEYLHLFPNKKYLTINYDTVVQDILEFQELHVNALYPTTGLKLPKKRKKQDFDDDYLSWMYRKKDKETSEVYYLHGIYDDPSTIIISEFQYDDSYGMTDSDIKYKLRRYLPSEIFNIYHNSIFLYIGCGMTVKQDRVLKIMGDFYGVLRNTISYALLNANEIVINENTDDEIAKKVNEIAKTEELFENWGMRSEEEQKNLKKALDDKEEELKNTMNVHVIWYSAPKNSNDGHESAKRQLFKYILDDTRERVKEAKKEKQRLEEGKECLERERSKQEAATKKRERERLQADWGGDTDGLETTTLKEDIKGISLSEEEKKQIEVLLQGKISMKGDTPPKYAIESPMYKIEGGLYEIYLISGQSGFYLSDEGATLVELDKIFELSEPDVIKNLVAILKQYGCEKNGKNIIIKCTPEDIHIKMSYLIQTISFMLNMKIFYV